MITLSMKDIDDLVSGFTIHGIENGVVVGIQIDRNEIDNKSLMKECFIKCDYCKENKLDCGCVV